MKYIGILLGFVFLSRIDNYKKELTKTSSAILHHLYSQTGKVILQFQKLHTATNFIWTAPTNLCIQINILYDTGNKKEYFVPEKEKANSKPQCTK